MSNILIVSANKSARGAWASALVSKGHVVTLMANGDEAITKHLPEFYNRGMVQLLISDTRLEGPIQGEQFTKEVKKGYGVLPILMIAKGILKNHGAKKVLFEPFDGKDLVTAAELLIKAYA